MATACSFLSEDQFLCSICLDVFTEPVSIPCGHNFCKACLTRHWEGKEQCQCPLCNEKFKKGLRLCVNTGFREVVENFKTHCVIADSDSPVTSEHVTCDCCLGNKSKASKTCLVCLTSYCETHLEPHLRVAALKRHKLTNPVHNLEGQICKKHNRMLELFCRTDQTCVCALCTEHSDHHTVPLEEAYAVKRAQKTKKKAEVQETKHKHRKRAQKVKVAVQTKRKGKDEVVANRVVSNQMHDPVMWWIPHQFNRNGRYVPGNCTEGSFYREVQAEGSTSWNSEESMHGVRMFIPGNENWVIRLGTAANCNALHVPVHFFLIKKPKRVIVFVDYDEGLVSFVDADTCILVYSFTGCNFNERIYLFYSPTEEDSWTQRLRMEVQKIKAWSQLPDTALTYCFICVVFLFALVYCICTF